MAEGGAVNTRRVFYEVWTTEYWKLWYNKKIQENYGL